MSFFILKLFKCYLYINYLYVMNMHDTFNYQPVSFNCYYCSIHRPLPAQQLCGVDGCEKLKKYSCSRTGVPLCSIQCYKANQLNIWNVVC